MLSCLRYGDINYFAACFLTVTGRRGNAYAYNSRVYDDISTSARASGRGRDYASNIDSFGRRYGTNFSSDHHCFRRSVQKVQRHLRRAERASSIAHRHWRLRFYFAAHRLRRCRADETPRTGIGVNNELLQQRTGIGVTAPITPRTGIGLTPRTAGSTIAFPKPVSAYAGLYALSPADLDNDYDSSSDSPDNTHRRSYYTNGVFISVPDNLIGVPDNSRKRDFHRCTYAVVGG